MTKAATRVRLCAHTNVIKYKLLASLQWMYNVAFEEQIFPDYSRPTLYSFPSFFASWHEVEMSASRTRSMSEKKMFVDRIIILPRKESSFPIQLILTNSKWNSKFLLWNILCQWKKKKKNHVWAGLVHSGNNYSEMLMALVMVNIKYLFIKFSKCFNLLSVNS